MSPNFTSNMRTKTNWLPFHPSTKLCRLFSLVAHCVKYARIRVFLASFCSLRTESTILDIYYSDLIRKNAGQRKPVTWKILRKEPLVINLSVNTSCTRFHANSNIRSKMWWKSLTILDIFWEYFFIFLPVLFNFPSKFNRNEVV